MSASEEQLYALMAVAEQQQQAVEMAIQQLKETKQQIIAVTAAQTQQTVSLSLKNGLDDGTEKLRSMALRVGNLEQRLQHSLDRLSWKYITIGLCFFFTLILAAAVFLALFMPSLDEIQQRRADLAKLEKYPVQLSQFDGKTLVRIKTKVPCYADKGSKIYDWCQIDPKKY